MLVLSPTELSTAQKEDPGIGQMWSALSNGDVTQVDKTMHRACPLLLREWDRLKMQQVVMYRFTRPPRQILLFSVGPARKVQEHSNEITA